MRAETNRPPAPQIGVSYIYHNRGVVGIGFLPTSLAHVEQRPFDLVFDSIHRPTQTSLTLESSIYTPIIERSDTIYAVGESVVVLPIVYYLFSQNARGREAEQPCNAIICIDTCKLSTKTKIYTTRSEE